VISTGSEVLKTQVIPDSFEVFKSSDPERKNYPNYKDAFGLIKHAQGDSGIVYFFNQKAGAFKKVPYIYPQGYEMGE
jgi:hypothetical protein